MASPASSARRAAQGARRTTQDAQQSAQDAATSRGATLLARLGYAAKGIVFVIVGALSARVAVGGGGSTSAGASTIDRQTALKAIYQQPFGKFLLLVLAIGLFGYALYCLTRAVLDTEHEGTEGKGILKRISYAVVAFSYGGLAIAAGKLAFGSGNGGKSSNASTRDWTSQLLDKPFGMWLVILAGIVVLGYAVGEEVKAYKASFMKKLDTASMSRRVRDFIEAAGRVGSAARGVVFAIIGIFLIVAAVHHNAGQAKGLGGALAELAKHSYGQATLAVVAVGLIAYGLFCMAQARYRRIAQA
jgi:uncharacterized protein DUF1206